MKDAAICIYCHEAMGLWVDGLAYICTECLQGLHKFEDDPMRESNP